MFRKGFKIKSNTNMRSSERKKFCAEIRNSYPSLSDEDFNLVIPNKDEISQMKAMTHSGEHFFAYFSGDNPIFFKIESTILPSIYTLWNYPKLVPTMATWPNVFEKLSNGADLMLPGVVLKYSGLTEEEIMKIKKGDVLSVNLVGNKSAIAVGISVVDGCEFFENKKGKAILIYHMYRDLLWEQGNKCHPPVVSEEIGKSDEKEVISDDDEESLDEDVIQDEMKDENQETNDLSEKMAQLTTENSDKVEIVEESVETEILENLTPVEQMDHLLKNCFLYSMKTLNKKAEFPILTSTYFKSYILPVCPSDKSLDIKKTSYKKLSVFLQEMQLLGLIKVEQLSKGVDSITFVNKEHDDVRHFRLPKDWNLPLQEDNSTVEKKDIFVYEPPAIRELHVVSGAVSQLFGLCNFKKGDVFSAPEVREVITSYVKQNNLQSEKKGEVTLDPVLSKALTEKSESVCSLKWEELHKRCLNKMSHAHEITFPGQNPVVKKGILECIQISTARRSGNKYVTLIHNLESYGVDPQAIAHLLQLRVAASTSVTPAVNKKGMQVLVQGNQVHHVGKILLGEYKLPKKYIKGLELASSGKKAK